MPVMRSVVAAGLCLALQAGAASAPFVHAHVGGDHDGGRIHTHLEGHGTHGHPSADRADVGTPNHDADAGMVASVPFFVAVHSDLQPDMGMPHAPVPIPDVSESLVRREPDVVRSHGPPDSRRSAPRAPPVFPS